MERTVYFTEVFENFFNAVTYVEFCRGLAASDFVKFDYSLFPTYDNCILVRGVYVKKVNKEGIK